MNVQNSSINLESCMEAWHDFIVSHKMRLWLSAGCPSKYIGCTDSTVRKHINSISSKQQRGGIVRLIGYLEAPYRLLLVECLPHKQELTLFSDATARRFSITLW
jgi:hypothetical protein